MAKTSARRSEHTWVSALSPPVRGGVSAAANCIIKEGRSGQKVTGIFHSSPGEDLFSTALESCLRWPCFSVHSMSQTQDLSDFLSFRIRVIAIANDYWFLYVLTHLVLSTPLGGVPQFIRWANWAILLLSILAKITVKLGFKSQQSASRAFLRHYMALLLNAVKCYCWRGIEGPTSESPSFCKWSGYRCLTHKRCNGRARTRISAAGRSWYSALGPKASPCSEHELNLSRASWRWDLPAPNSIVMAGRSCTGLGIKRWQGWRDTSWWGFRSSETTIWSPFP